MSIETPNFIAAPEVEPEEYYDPFVTNEDGTIDLNLNGNALVSGSLGIGTTNPTSKLQVAGNTTPSIDNQFDLGSSSLRWKNVYVGTIVGNLVGAASTVLIVDDTNTTGNPLRFINFSSTKSGISNIYADSLLTFNPTNNNLGIGTTNPGEKLQVDGNIRVGISTTSNYIAFRGTTSDGTNASGGGDQSVGLKRWEHTYIGERIYESGTEKSELLLFKGNDGAGEFGPDRVRVLAGEFRVDTYAGPSSGTFEQVGNALSNNALIVSDNGYLGIGTSNPAFRLQVNGDIYLNSSLVSSGSGSSESSGSIIFSAASSTSNIDHIWNSDANVVDGVVGTQYGNLPGIYHFVNDGTYKSTGNSALRAGGFFNIDHTGTLNQKLQIEGGAYISGNVGIGITNSTFKLHVAGSVSKGSGSFVIDHPLNETKNLVHSFVEGPRADLIYRGTVSLIDGSATINLDEEYELIPGTWKALCRNPQVWISNIDGWTNCRGTVEDGILIIEAQTASNESVNWLVIAERQDKYMYDTEWTDDNGRPILEPLKTQ